MNQKITILSIIYLMTLFSYSQKKGLKDNVYFSKSEIHGQNQKLNRGGNKYNKGYLFIKNKIFFKNSKKNSSQSISSSLVIKHKLDAEISQSWNETTSQWINDSKVEYNYNSSGYLIQDVYSYWDGSQWIYDDSKTQYTYDTNENLIHIIDFYWDGSHWINSEKVEYLYYNGKLVQVIDYYWDGNQWVYESKNQYTYDTNGNMIQSIFYYRVGNQWVYSYKDQYTYDTNGNLTQAIHYYWDDDHWDNVEKIEFVYDTNRKLTQLLEFNWDGSQWVNNQIRQHNYHSTNGNLEQYIDSYWDGSQWSNTLRTDFSYNNIYSFSDLILPYFFSNTYDGFSYSYLKLFFNHMLTNGLQYVWDETLNDWVIRNNYDFSYSEQEILAISHINGDKIKIYPNPVSNILTIKSDIIQIDKVEIYSVLGKKIKEINLDSNNINVEDITRGIYVMRLYSEKGTTIKKLIKK